MCANSLVTRDLRELEDQLFGAVDQVDRLAGPLPAQAGDLLARADQAAQRGRFTDDARSVRRSRSPARALRARGSAPDRLRP